MPKLSMRVALVVLFCGALEPACTNAQQAAVSTGDPGTAEASEPGTSTGPVWSQDKLAVLMDVEDIGRKMTQLAQAMPSEKFTWRPGGVGNFSVSEVYLLAAARYYHMPSVWGGVEAKSYEVDGAATAGRIDPIPLEKSTTDKDEIVNHLVDSVSYFNGIMKTLTDADMQKTVKILGRTTTPHLSLILMDQDLHELLADAISDARSNGVVLPWMNSHREEQSKRALRNPATPLH
jgi:hypothetical protein